MYFFLSLSQFSDLKSWLYLYMLFINFKSEIRFNPLLQYHSLQPFKTSQAGAGLYREITHNQTHIHNLNIPDKILYILSNISITGDLMRIGCLVLLQTTQKSCSFDFLICLYNCSCALPFDNVCPVFHFSHFSD